MSGSLTVLSRDGFLPVTSIRSVLCFRYISFLILLFCMLCTDSQNHTLSLSFLCIYLSRKVVRFLHLIFWFRLTAYSVGLHDAEWANTVVVIVVVVVDVTGRRNNGFIQRTTYIVILLCLLFSRLSSFS